MDEGTPGPDPDEERKRRQRESTARYRARKRGEDVPLLPSGPKRKVDPSRPKTCRDCGELKPPSEFFLVRDSGQPDRLHSYCRACCSTRTRAARDRDPGRDVARQRQKYWANPEAARQATREYRQANIDRVRQWDRARRPAVRAAKLLRSYGITVEQYEKLADMQGGVCAICRRKDDQGHLLAVDHCHDSGAVRGLLCHKCNVALGLFRDDPAALTAAAEYLRNPPAPGAI